MSMDSIIVINSAGIPIASYPKEINVVSNVMSGLLSSFLSGIEQLGLGAVESIKIGEKNFVVKKLKGAYVVIVLDKYDKIVRWFIDILANALGKYLDILSSDEGMVLEGEFEAFKKILMNYYEGYSKFREKYIELRNIYYKAKKLLGNKTLQILNTVFNPDIKLVEEGDLNFEKINLDDLNVVIELMQRGVEKLKENVKKML